MVESAAPGSGPKLNAGPSNIHAPGWQRLRRGELLLSSKCAAGRCWHCRCADRVHRHTRDVCLYCDSRDAYRPQKYPAPRELRKRSSPHEGRPGVHRVLRCLPGVAESRTPSSCGRGWGLLTVVSRSTCTRAPTTITEYDVPARRLGGTKPKR